MREGALVGRHRELQVLVSACKDAAGAMFVRGDAGVGKTRLLDAVLDEAELLGARVLRASIDELDRDLPYAGLRAALRPALADAMQVGLHDEADAVAAALELRLADAGGSSARDGLAVAFEAGRRLLTRLSHDAPVVLALDDLHAADPDSVRVFGLFAAHLRDEPVTMLATLRTGGHDVGADVTELVERLVAEGLASVVDVHELDRAETRALTHDLLDARPDDALVEAVWDASRGNPFYATEAIRSLDDAGRVVVHDDRASLAGEGGAVTISARASLLHRVFCLGSAPRRLSRVLTAFQRISLDRLDLAAELSDLDPRDADRAFDDLVAANVLREVALGRYEFVHPIVKATLYDDLGPAERRRVHARIADRLRAERDAGLPVSIAELAAHVAVAGVPGDGDAVAILTEAGRSAVASAPLTAARWFARARTLLVADAPEVGPLLAAEARALFLASRTTEAVAVGEDALRCLSHGRQRTRTGGVVVQSLTTLGRFEDALETADWLLADAPVPQPRIRAMRATVLVYLDRFAEAEHELTESRRAADDAHSHSAALGGLAACAHAQGDLDRCLALLDQQAELESVLGPGARLASLAVRSSYLANAGLPNRAAEVLAEARRHSEHLGGSAFRATLDVAGSIIDWMAGRWDAAVDASRLIGIEPDRAGVFAALARCAELIISVDRGEFLRARELADEVRGSRLGSTFASGAVARLDLALGDVDAATTELHAVIERDRRSGRRSAEHMILSELVEASLATGDAASARCWADQLTALAAAGGLPHAAVLADRAQAKVSGDRCAALRSIALADEHGLVVEAARGRLVLGALGESPAVHLAMAYETFGAVGAEPELRAVAAAMRHAGVAVPRPVRSQGGPLTDTELELARLVHEGLTNRQIARVLYMSPKTVEVYLSRTFTKTGCANRLELAVAVSEGRLEGVRGRHARGGSGA